MALIVYESLLQCWRSPDGKWGRSSWHGQASQGSTGLLSALTSETEKLVATLTSSLPKTKAYVLHCISWLGGYLIMARKALQVNLRRAMAALSSAPAPGQ